MLQQARVYIILLAGVLLLTGVTPLFASGTPPNIPVQQIPTDLGYTNTLTPTFTWTIPTDPEEDQLHFKVAFSNSPTMATSITADSSAITSGDIFSPTPPLSSGQSANMSFTPGAGNYSQFADGNKVYWTVTANDTTSDSATTAIKSFTVDTTVPVVSNAGARNELGKAAVSPNGDAQGDQVQIDYTLSETSSVTLQIYDSTNALKRTLINGATVADGAQNTLWDGKDSSLVAVADGIYQARFNVTDLAGNPGTQVVVNITVDTSAPAVSTQTPALTNNPFSPNGDGKKDTVTLHWTLAADALTSVTVYSAADLVTPVRTISAAAAATAGNYDAVWDGLTNTAGALADGSYIIQVVSLDDAVNSSVLQINITMDKVGPVLNTISSTPNPFSPEISSTTFSWTQDEDATISVTIKDINSNLIRDLQGPTWTTAGAQTLIWDGRDNSNAVAGDGTYNFIFSATDIADNTTAAQGQVKVDTVSPALSVAGITPSPFSPNSDGNRDTVDVSYSITKEATVEVAIFNSLGVQQRTIELELRSPSTYTATWDGRDTGGTLVADGNYIVRLFATDPAGNKATEATGEIILDNTAPTLTNLNVDPTPFSPNASTGSRDTVTVSYDLSETSAVTIDVYNSLNAKIDTIITDQSQNTGSHTATWDGRTSGGVFAADGGYTIRVFAKDEAENTSATLQGNVTVDNTAPTLTNLTATPSPFAPDGDGVLDTTTILYTLNDASAQCTVEIAIYFGALKIRDLQAATPVNVGAINIVWDGRDNNSLYQGDGTYSVRINATDEAMNPATQATVDVRIDKGAPVMSTARFVDNRNTLITDDTIEITFSMAIDDTSIVGAAVTDKFLLSGVGAFGAGPQIFTGKTPNDKIVEIRLGAGAVKPAESADTIALKTGGVKSLTGVTSTDVTPRIIGDGTPPVLTGNVIFSDTTNDGLSAGDTLTLTFEESVVVVSSSVNGFHLYPSGNFGAGASVQAGGTAKEVVIRLGSSPTIQISGVYGADAGATGIEIESNSNTISDLSGNYAIPNPTAAPLDIKSTDTVGPKVVTAIWTDYSSGSSNGGLSVGDRIAVTFDKPIIVSGNSINDFKLPVSGDSFGAGATYAVDSTKSVVITLGTSPAMKIQGTYIVGNNSIGSPSGLDINTLASFIKDIGGNAAVANYPVDIQTTDTTAPNIVSAKLIGSMGDNLISPTTDLVTIQVIVDDDSLKTGDVTADLTGVGLTADLAMTRLGATTTFELVTTVNNLTGQRTIRVQAKDYSGNASAITSFTVQVVEPASSLIAEVNPSSVQKSGGTLLFKVHAKPQFQTYSKGIDELRVFIPVDVATPSSGYQYASSLEVFVGGSKLAATDYVAAFSNSYLKIDFTNRITSATTNPAMELRFALTVPDVVDSPTGRSLSVQVRQDDFPASYWQTASDGDADGKTDNNNSVKVVVNDISIESIKTTLDFSNSFWRINFTVTLNAEMDITSFPTATFLPQNAVTIKSELNIQNMDFTNITTNGVTKTVYTGYARIPVDNPEYQNNYTLYLRGFRDSSGVLVAQISKANNEMSTGFIVTAFNNPVDMDDLIITLRATTGVVAPFSLKIIQPGDIPVTIAPANIQTYRQILFQAIYRMDRNFPGQTIIEIQNINLNPAPLAAMSFYSDQASSDGGVDIRFSEQGIHWQLPEGSLPAATPCMIIPLPSSLSIGRETLEKIHTQDELQAVKSDINLITGQKSTRLGKLSVNVADVAPEKRKQLLFGIYQDNKVIPVETRIIGDSALCEVAANQRIGLFLDETAPVVQILNSRNRVLLKIKDNGSGIAENGVKLDFGSITVAAKPLEDDIYVADVPREIGTGIHECQLTAMDRSGNKSAPQRLVAQAMPAGGLSDLIAYPSPASNLVNIRYKLGTNADRASLRIYDSGGRLVMKRDLTGTLASPIPYTEVWTLRTNKGREVANGTYFYEIRVTNGDQADVQRGRFAVLR